MGDNTYLYSGTTSGDVPLCELDFKYIQDCSDVKKLEKIYRVLVSKVEGNYPELEKCCEDRLRELHPHSRLLRKETPLFSSKDLGVQERTQINDEIENWTSDMKFMESDLQSQAREFAQEHNQELPPVRSGSITLTADGTKSAQANPQKRNLPRDYKEWDKIDVEKELEKVDKAEKKPTEKALVGNNEVLDIPDEIDSKGMTESEKLITANREKDKGNEAFRSNDFKEAIKYYSRSISLLPTVASYNNRSLVRLKCSEWQEAINDCNIVLKMEPENVKAMLRRGTAYKGQKQYEKAKSDLSMVISKEPNNKRAQELLDEIEKEWKAQKQKGRRMVIEDVEEIEPEEEVNNEMESIERETVKIEKSESVKDNISVNDKGDNKHGKQSRFVPIEEMNTFQNEKDKDHESNGRGTASSDLLNNSKELNRDDDEEEGDDEIHIMHENPVENGVNNVGIEVIDNSGIDTQGTDSLRLDEEESLSEIEVTADDISNVEIKGELNERVNAQNLEPDDDRLSPADGNEYLTAESDNESSEDEKLPETAMAKKEVHRPVFFMRKFPDHCVALREAGNTLFKNGQYGEACQKYTQVINLLEHESDQTVNISLMYSNRAACHLKTGDLSGCVKDCNMSLQLVPYSVKPLLRRAAAYEHLENFQKAYVDYRHVSLLDMKIEQAHHGTKRCQEMLANRDGPKWRQNVHLPAIPPTEIPVIMDIDEKPTVPVVSHVPLSQTDNKSLIPSSVDNAQSQQNIGVTKAELLETKITENQSKQNISKLSQSETNKFESSQSKATKADGLSESTSSERSQSKFTSVQSHKSETPKTDTSQSKTPKVDASQSESSKTEIHFGDTIKVSNTHLGATEKEAKKDVKKKELSPQENFEALKAEGNEFVEKSKFQEAILCYSKCAEILPSEVVTYTNRALCYLRTNQANKAEADCTKALSLDKDNVKALFRRAQAKKMLKAYKDGLADLSHLLKVDAKNTAALKELEVMKTYWREELKNIKNNMNDVKQSPPNSKTDKSPALTEDTKQRKRVVIQEVGGDDENDATSKGTKLLGMKDVPPRTKKTDTSHTNKTDTSPTKKTDTSHTKKTENSSCPKFEKKSEPVLTKPVQETTDSQPADESPKSKDGKSTQKKSKIKDSGPGIPSVPKTAPKLAKATPYEFLSAWNALKTSSTVEPYYDLLKQIRPADLKTVISNKLDGPMLNVISRCVAEYFIPRGEKEQSYQILKNLSTVDRFGTISMFLSKQEKSDIKTILTRLEIHPTSKYTVEDVHKLKKAYGATTYCVSACLVSCYVYVHAMYAEGTAALQLVFTGTTDAKQWVQIHSLMRLQDYDDGTPKDNQ